MLGWIILFALLSLFSAACTPLVVPTSSLLAFSIFGLLSVVFVVGVARRSKV